VRQFRPRARSNPSTRLALLMLFTKSRDLPGCWERGGRIRGKEGGKEGERRETRKDEEGERESMEGIN
jgi:hypothetical protein